MNCAPPRQESTSKKLERDLRGAREESELLTLQTHQVQQELERMHAERVRLEDELKSRVALPGLDDVTIGEVVVGGERDSPPHRELSFIVRGTRAGARHVAEAAVRLVEHWGRPGLVIFADDSRTALFETWRESGREDGRPYMLLVHGEESAQRVYDSDGHARLATGPGAGDTVWGRRCRITRACCRRRGARSHSGC